MLDRFLTLQLTHLIKKGSDHAALELECSQVAIPVAKRQNPLSSHFWVNHATFKQLVEDNWVGTLLW
ncbi:hypothetical protein H5410_056794 [Solanum commersonii]|uniref:Uncharacterized protein n=1 Tax=Solanum commersonii TaxID=4109 RepID=A0A9J5WNA8_SOLCO|nr:hypothetical protein H5410_056794 [Solanum commersonii]